MKTSELISEISNKTGIEKRAVKTVFEALFEAVRTDLMKQNKVFIKGFGVFSVKIKEPRVYKNPHNGEARILGRVARTHFRANKKLKECVASVLVQDDEAE